MPTLAIDLSSWNYNPTHPIPFAQMKAHGFELCINKASMGGGPDYQVTSSGKKYDTVQIFSDQARAAGMDVALYHWVDASQDIGRQVDFFLAQIERIKPVALFLDWEQWWANWQQRTAFKRGELSRDKVAHLNIDKNIAAVNKVLALLMTQSGPLEVYTYSFFIEEICLEAKHAIPPWPFPASKKPWLASAVHPPQEHIICETWPEFDQFILDHVSSRTPYQLAYGRPKGITDWSWWQFASGIHLPGAATNYDLNILNPALKYSDWVGKPQTTRTCPTCGGSGRVPVCP